MGRLLPLSSITKKRMSGIPPRGCTSHCPLCLTGGSAGRTRRLPLRLVEATRRTGLSQHSLSIEHRLLPNHLTPGLQPLIPSSTIAFVNLSFSIRNTCLILSNSSLPSMPPTSPPTFLSHPPYSLPSQSSALTSAIFTPLSLICRIG